MPRLRAAYDNLMAAGVVAGILSKLYLVVSLQFFRYEVQTLSKGR